MQKKFILASAGSNVTPTDVGATSVKPVSGACGSTQSTGAKQSPSSRAVMGELLGPPTLLEGERMEDYTALSNRILDAVRPRDAIEELWVRDLADLTWEILRVRRIKGLFLRATRDRGLQAALLPLTRKFLHAKDLVHGQRLHDEAKTKEASQLLQTAGVEEDDITALAYVQVLDVVERLDRLMTQSEGRRDAVLREIDRRREAAGRHARTAIADVTDAEFEDVTPPSLEAA